MTRSLLLRSLSFLGATVLLAAACGRSPLDDLDAYGGDGFGGQGAASTTSLSSASVNPMATGTGGVGPTSSGTGPGPGQSSSTGMGGACMTNTDCTDADNCTTDACTDGMCTHKLRDDDGDGFVSIACGGDDCNDLDPQVNSSETENCFDGVDNDCNGVADCLDPACVGVPNCGCKPVPENCTNGKDDNCDGKVDCNDPTCLGTPACGCDVNEIGKCTNGFDDDCDGQIDCADSDCAGDPTCQCMGMFEDCSNGLDDNCNGLIDCADPVCTGSGPCLCMPPGSPEVCNDTIDNDCDGKIDCADPDCNASPSCKQCVAEICNDGIDNNCDGKIDCADPTCNFAPNCKPVPEICNNGLDDDKDGLTDCADPDCSNAPNCVLKQANCLSPKLIPGSGSYTGDTTGNISETKGSCGGDAGEAVFYFVLSQPTKVHLDSIGSSFDSVLYVRTGKCNTGKEIGCDDDSGGNHAAKLEFNILYPGTYYVFLDGFTVDPNLGANQGPFVLNVVFTPNPPEICDDGIDNDGDHYVDCADPDCTNVGMCLNCNGGKPPTPEFGEGKCTDGQDNDCDGKIDCGDPDCSASDYYITECCSGKDENMNGIIDDFNCRCADDSTCPMGQFCYNHTAYACGIPCDSFFGDVCPFVAAGSFCNHATHQCEF